MSGKNLPWKKEYKVFGIPETFQPYPEEPVHDILTIAARKYKKCGLVQFDYKMTYPEVNDSVNRLATALHNLGLTKEDRVATLLPTSIQFIIADYAISRAGLVHIPSSSLEPLSTLEHKFKEGSPRALICLAKYYGLAKKLLQKGEVEFVILTKLEDYSSNMFNLLEKEDHYENVLWLSDIIAKTEPDPPTIKFNVYKDLETLLFTGGTTGEPKGCMLSHRNIYANAIQNLHAFGRSGHLFKGAASVLLGIPFFHSYGHIIMHTMTLYGFNQILVPEPRDTEGMVRMIKKHHPFMQIGVPTQFMKILENELEGIGMLGLSGSAPLPPNIQEQYEQKAGGGIMEGYGLSEMSPVTHLNTSFMIRLLGGRKMIRISNILLAIPGTIWGLNFLMRLIGPGNIGRGANFIIPKLVKFTKKKDSRRTLEKRGTAGIPFPDTEVKLLEIDTGRPLSWEEILSGKAGEMCLRGPQRMLGYWPFLKSGIDNDGFIRTNDIVKVDERGYFYIVDRIKDMIIVSGYKVYSRVVEDVLYTHPAVEHAAIVGVPDKKREGSERVVAYIQVKENHKEIDENTFIEFLKSKVAKYSVPKIINIIEEMPLTGVQKIDKKELRKSAIEKFAETIISPEMVEEPV